MNRPGTFVPALLLAAACLGPWAAGARSAPVPRLVTLRNGLRVVLAPDSDATAVDVAVWYPVSAQAEGTAYAGARHLIERLMFHGSETTPDGVFVARMGGEGALLNNTLTADYSGVGETVPGEALGEALRLEADRMAGLRTSAQVFEQARRASEQDVRGRDSRPLIERAVSRLGATVFAGEPWGLPLEGRESALAALTPEDVEAWRQAHYTAGSAVLTLVGRFDPDATLPLVRRLFEPLPRGPGQPAAPATHATPGPRRDWERVETPARLLLVGWRVPGQGDPDYPVIELLAAVLGLGDDSRLNHALCTTAHVAVTAQCGLDRHRDATLFWTLAALPPGVDSSRVEGLLVDQVSALASAPLPGPDLDRARAQLLTGELFRQQAARARGQMLAEAVLASGDPAATARRLERIERTTPADLQRVAQRIFTDSARSTLWLVPTGGSQ